MEQATELGYFPPNATSALQPIDQGVVYFTKVAYRTRLTERLFFVVQEKLETKVSCGSSSGSSGTAKKRCNS
ncbi:hypothetical protein HPB50_027402 [Hyalomma asiaticum]|uniref:Uncharacterized protein n=1 Tax=Hyalomma asiaticum TaxID=266040 RepID=A0ACB7RX04_HYAAI|nr:hypothetical protein HPB50_027402 [Hyalomma asiaticum]